MLSHASTIAGLIHYLTGIPFEKINGVDTCSITKINMNNLTCDFIN